VLKSETFSFSAISAGCSDLGSHASPDFGADAGRSPDFAARNFCLSRDFSVRVCGFGCPRSGRDLASVGPRHLLYPKARRFPRAPARVFPSAEFRAALLISSPSGPASVCCRKILFVAAQGFSSAAALATA
jgi:hypothetical protein